MKYQTIILLTLMMLCGVSDSDAQQTKRLTADKHNEYGLIYSLPITALEIEIEATHTIKKAGPFYQYAKKHIGTADVITADSDSWELTALNVRPVGISDGEEYLMQLKSGSITAIYVNENNMIRSINSEPDDDNPTEELSPKEKELSSLDEKEYLKYVNEDFLISQSSAKKAQILAQSLMEVRDAKISLTRGTAETMPSDGHQLELMLNSLNRQEQVMTDAFVGTTQTESVVKKIIYIPTPENQGRQVLFRLSDFAGIVESDDYSGDPVYIDVEITRQGEMPINEKGEEKRLPKDAVIYNIPGEADVRISFLGEKLYDENIEFSQFGLKFGLNPSLFTSKKEPSYVIFNPTTGAIKEIGTMPAVED